MNIPYFRYDFLYNEFALQFEIGYELRKHGFKVYFEKNVTAYSNCSTLKKEIEKAKRVLREAGLLPDEKAD